MKEIISGGYAAITWMVVDITMELNEASCHENVLSFFLLSSSYGMKTNLTT